MGFVTLRIPKSGSVDYSRTITNIATNKTQSFEDSINIQESPKVIHHPKFRLNIKEKVSLILILGREEHFLKG
jgi:hypothetical protein